MDTTKQLINVLKHNWNKTTEYFNRIQVSNEKTQIKFGSIDNKELSINFFIHGQFNDKINDIEGKLTALFDTDNDLTIINRILSEIAEPKEIIFSPFLKISKESEPLIHAFMITIRF